MFITVHFRTDNGQCGFNHFMPEPPHATWRRVFAANWRDSERFAEEVFAFLNGEGECHTTGTKIIAQGLRSMSVGDRIDTPIGTWVCDSRGWSTFAPGEFDTTRQEVF